MSHPSIMKYYRSDVERNAQGSALPLVWSLIIGGTVLFTAIEYLF